MFFHPAALNICPVPSGGTKMGSARGFTLLAGGPFLSRSSRAGCLPSPLCHRDDPVWESWNGLAGRAFQRCHPCWCCVSSLQLGGRMPFLPGIVIMACSAINIHWEALLIVFLINSLRGTLGVDEECALVGMSSHGKSIPGCNP